VAPQKQIQQNYSFKKKIDDCPTWFLARLIMITPQNQTCFFHFIILLKKVKSFEILDYSKCEKN
jgi:hypothetical protein